MNTLQGCINAVLIEGTGDWVYLAGVVRTVELINGGSATEVRQWTLQIIRSLMESGLIEVGDLTKDGFRKWLTPIGDSVSRVEREWNTLGRPPSLGEICWLQNTAKGNALGKELLKGRKQL